MSIEKAYLNDLPLLRLAMSIIGGNLGYIVVLLRLDILAPAHAA